MNLAVIITLTVGWLAGIVAVANIQGARISDVEHHVDARFDALEHHFDARLKDQGARFDDLERHFETRFNDLDSHLSAQIGSLVEEVRAMNGAVRELAKEVGALTVRVEHLEQRLTG